VKSVAVTPFFCTTRSPLEITVMTASVFKAMVATSRLRSVPGGTTKVTSSGVGCMFSMPVTSVFRPGVAPAVSTKASAGPRGRPPEAQENSTAIIAIASNPLRRSFFM